MTGQAAGRNLAAVLQSPAFVLLLAFALRVWGLGARSLWLDEATSWAYAQQPVATLWANQTADPHPPLYYVFLHFWLGLGNSEFLLRWPSLLAGVLAVALTYHLGRSWRRERAGWLAALLLAVSPLAIWYSQEARMYQLVLLWGLLSVVWLVTFLRTGSKLAWLAYVGFSVIGLYTHYSMLALVAAEAVFVLSRGRSRLLAAWLVGQVAILLAFLPWLPTALGHAQTVAAGSLHPFVRLEQLAAGRGLVLPNTSFLTMLAVLVAGLALVLALWPTTRQRSWPLWGSLAGGLALYLLLTAATAVPLAASFKRQGLVTLPFLLLAVAVACKRCQSSLLYLALALVTAPALVAGYLQPKDQWREAASLVEADLRPDDLVLLHADYTQVAFAYYYQGQAAMLPAPFAEQAIAELSERYPRVWLVLNHQSYVDPAGQVQAWLEQRDQAIGRAKLVGIDVWLYQRPSR